MDRIEYLEDEEKPERTGWYINTYDSLGGPPIDSTGPYLTKTEALRLWRDHTPFAKIYQSEDDVGQN